MDGFMYTTGWHGESESAASDMGLSFTSGGDSCYTMVCASAKNYECYPMFQKISENVIEINPIEIIYWDGQAFLGEVSPLNEKEIPNSLKELRDHFSGLGENGDKIQVTVNVKGNRLTLHGEGDHEMTFVRGI